MTYQYSRTSSAVDDAIEDGRSLHVASRWDKHIRSWTTTIEDERDYQVGDCLFDGTRSDRAVSIRLLQHIIDIIGDARSTRP